MVMEFMEGGDLGGLLETNPKGKLKVDISSPAIPGVFLKRKGEKVVITQTYVVVRCLGRLKKEGLDRSWQIVGLNNFPPSYSSPSREKKGYYG